MMAELQEERRVPWLIVLLVCSFNVMHVAELHYEAYLFYVINSPQDPRPSIPLHFSADDAQSLCPVVLILLLRNCTPIFIIYAGIISLLFLQSLFLLVESAIPGIDRPPTIMDGSVIINDIFGGLSGLVAVIIGASKLFVFVSRIIKRYLAGDKCRTVIR